MSVMGRLELNNLRAIVPTPTTESGRRDMLAVDVNEQDWGEAKTDEGQELLQDAYPVNVSYEDTEPSLAHHRGAAWVLQEVPLSIFFEKVMATVVY